MPAAEVARAYVAAVEGIDRIRFTTSHPVEFSDSLIEVYGQVPELVSFLHLPVQSGSDRILAMMKRGHMALEYKAKIRRLREIRPDITISSDHRRVRSHPESVHQPRDCGMLAGRGADIG